MSITQHGGRTTTVAPPRVRDQARDVARLLAFSGAAASGLALVLVLLVHLGQRG